MKTLEFIVVSICILVCIISGALIIHHQTKEITSLKQQLMNCQTNR